MIAGDDSFPFSSLRPSCGQQRLNFNSAIKTIALHRNLIKYVYGTPAHGPALPR